MSDLIQLGPRALPASLRLLPGIDLRDFGSSLIPRPAMAGPETDAMYRSFDAAAPRCLEFPFSTAAMATAEPASGSARKVPR